MIINFFRSSSFGQWAHCKFAYFCIYVLGLPSKSNLKADKGTVVHKVLECIAKLKKLFDETSDDEIVFTSDEGVGTITVSREDFYKITFLSNEATEAINKTRVNKANYCHPCKLPYKSSRMGVELIELLIDRIHAYYVEHTPHEWKRVDFRDVTNWTWMALEIQDGLVDPRKRKIIAVEPRFDIEIKEDWAKYDWLLPDGSRSTGFLRLKGTVDLICEIEPGIAEVIDWKTGQRMNWAIMKAKSYKDICKDPQLMIYFYALSKLYPDIKQFIVSICFIRDGGVFSVCMESHQLIEVEEMLRERFEEIRADQFPDKCDEHQNSPKCKYMCDFYKMASPEKGTNMCKYLHKKIGEVGMEEVVQIHTVEGFEVGYYQAPGEVEQVRNKS